MPAERAGYTVTMFLIDVSPSMGKLREVELSAGPKGETRTAEMTNLQWSLQFVLLKIQEMIYNGRKTDQCGVILFGTEETNNIVNGRSGGYEHVAEYIPIGHPNANTLAKLQALEPSTVIGDPIDAIIVGIETQDTYLAKKKSWTRKMVLLTDGENPIEVEDWELTCKKMNSLNIITTIVGVDFDDEEFGFVEEDKSNIKRTNEEFFHEFAAKLDGGVIGTAAFALQECVRPDIKQVKSALTATVLRLGDVEVRPEEAIELSVKMSKCTAMARPPPMKKFAKRVKPEETDKYKEGNRASEEETGTQDIYAQLEMQTEYYPAKQSTDEEKDEESKESERKNISKGIDPDEKIERDDLIRGFKYGASYAPCPDGQFPRLPTQRGFDICGFFSDRHFRRDYALGEVSYVWADPGSGQSQITMSSIVQAMLDRSVITIARYVSREGMDPRMGVLVPRAFEEVDCFLWIQMPFADDVRRYTFPSLENLVNKKGGNIESHAYLPTKEQLDTMENFVDAMDLMKAGDKDENGDRLPWFDPRFSYNPAVHRIKQALFHAAIVTDLRSNPLPPPHPEVIKYFEPPRRVLKRAHDAIEDCINVFKVKQVPKRIVRQRKDGHARAEDDDDDLLLLDAPKPSLRNTASQSQTQAEEPSATLVESEKAAPVKKKEEKMDVDSETEPESDAEFVVPGQSGVVKTSVKTPHLPSPSPSLFNASQASQGFSQPQSQSQSQSQEIVLDEGRAPGRIIGTAHPLADFRKNIKQGDLVSKAVEDLGYVVKDIVLKPFSSRRQSEVIECMMELRETCLTEDEIDAWNAFLRDLKESCLSTSVVNNKAFWKAVQANGQHLSLISGPEAKKLRGKSDVSEIEAEEFMQS